MQRNPSARDRVVPPEGGLSVVTHLSLFLSPIGHNQLQAIRLLLCSYVFTFHSPEVKFVILECILYLYFAPGCMPPRACICLHKIGQVEKFQPGGWHVLTYEEKIWNVWEANLTNFTFSATTPEIWRLQQPSMMEGRGVGRRDDGFQD